MHYSYKPEADNPFLFSTVVMIVDVTVHSYSVPSATFPLSVSIFFRTY